MSQLRRAMADLPEHIKQAVREAVANEWFLGGAQRYATEIRDGQHDERGHVLHALLGARAALAAIEAADGWQPIETAPKNGTALLVGHEQAVFDAWWNGSAWVDGTTNFFDDENEFSPTHWRPLPAPPAKEGE